jgi:ATP-dependent helicase/nuclease subunit A
MRAGDVLALVRTRGAMFRELIKAFKRAGLPVAGADRMVLRDELAVEDCLALMRVALDPADDLALASMLKGPWCNLDDDDADIFPLAHGRQRETLYARLMASTDAKYAFARSFVSELTARAGHNPFDFLSWALETPHEGGATGWERMFARLGAESRDPLEELLQRALHLAPQEAPTLQRFLYDIEVDAGQVKRELEAETGAVRVMTVHGAKGLEAPVVILPDCTAEANDKPEEGLIFDDAEGPYISMRKSDDDAKCAAARAAHAERMLGEHWRLLYVAMTRPVIGSSSAAHSSATRRAASRRELASCRRGRVAQTRRQRLRHALRRGPAPRRALRRRCSRRRATRAGAAPGVGKNAGAWRRPARTRRAVAYRACGCIALLAARRRPAPLSTGRLIHGLLERLPELAPERRLDAAHVGSNAMALTRTKSKLMRARRSPLSRTRVSPPRSDRTPAPKRRSSAKRPAKPCAALSIAWPSTASACWCSTSDRSAGAATCRKARAPTCCSSRSIAKCCAAYSPAKPWTARCCGRKRRS